MNYPKYEQASLRIMTHNVWNGNPGGRDARYPGFYAQYSPDILCLQEMSPRICTPTLIEGLERDYEFVPVDTQGQQNYTPVLVKKGVFRILECGWHLFGGLNDSGSKSVTWAVLEQVSNGVRLGVASNHFWWEEDGLENDASRVQNVREFQAFVDYMRVKYDIPVFSMGDLNCAIPSNPYREMLRLGAIDTRLCATVSSSRSNTLHEYPVLNPDTGVYERGSAPVGTHMDAIDHIMLYGMDRAEVYIQNVVTEQAALDQSDHCPVYVDVTVWDRDEKNPRVLEK